MTIAGEHSPGWRDLVVPAQAATSSVILRYAPALELVHPQLGLDRERLAACSLGEGIAIRRLPSRKGVNIVVFDETSHMHTGTYKALDACVTTAALTCAGARRVVASSGGNLSAALGAYCQNAGIEALLFQPSSTLFKQNPRFFGGSSRLISVDLPEPEVKSLARAVAERFSIRSIPDTGWRLAASAARAMFLLEVSEDEIGQVDFLGQTLCAGFGPIGIYTCLAALRAQGLLRAARVPRLLGFQQEANAPMARAWRAGEGRISAQHVAPRPDRYIEPGLYNTNPGRHYDRLAGLMRSFGGEMMTIGDEDYRRMSDLVRRDLSDAGVQLSTLPGTDTVLEKTGLMTGVGIYRAIDDGLLQRGETVAYLLTGGRRELRAGAVPTPELVVDGSRDEDAWVSLIGERFDLAHPPG